MHESGLDKEPEQEQEQEPEQEQVVLVLEGAQVRVQARAGHMQQDDKGLAHVLLGTR